MIVGNRAPTCCRTSSPIRRPCVVAGCTAAKRSIRISINQLRRQLFPGVRHLMWNGKWLEADQRMHRLDKEAGKLLADAPRSGDDRIGRFRRLLRELSTYLNSNRHSLAACGAAYERGLRISSFTG
jgi:hypothetical protein